MSALARNYGRLLVSPAFLGFAIGGGCATTSMYAFIGASPFIFAHQLNRPAYEVGIYPAIVLAGVWIGSVAATRLIPRLPIDRLAVWANMVSVAASFAFLAAVLSGHLSVLLAIVPMFVFGIGAGVASPAALTQAISVNPEVIGSASGLYGFSQMGVGAICTALVGTGQRPRAGGGRHPGRRGRDRPGRVLDRATSSRAGDQELLTGFYCRQSLPLPSIRRRAAFQSVMPNSGEARCALARAA